MKSYTLTFANGTVITVDAEDDESAKRLATEYGVALSNLTSISSKPKATAARKPKATAARKPKATARR